MDRSNKISTILNKQKSSLDIIFESFCTIVKSFPEDRAIYVKWQLADIVAKEELKNI